MKDFEKQMAELEKKLEKMGEQLNDYYTKLGEQFAEKYNEFGKKMEEKYSKAYGAKQNAEVWSSESRDLDECENHPDACEENTKKSDIEKILPYLDEDSLHELVESFIAGESKVNMKKALPYLEEDDVSLLIKKLSECEGEKFNGLTVDDVLPYAADEDVDVLFMKGVRDGKIDKRLIAYASEECWHELVKEYCKDEDSKLDIDEVFPYLDEDDIRLIFKTYLKRQKNDI